MSLEEYKAYLHREILKHESKLTPTERRVVRELYETEPPEACTMMRWNIIKFICNRMGIVWKREQVEAAMGENE